MEQDADKRFAAAVRKQREAQGLSQNELAEKLKQFGVSFQGTTIYKIEGGKRKVTVAEAVAIGHALKLSMHELLDTGADSAFIAKEYLLDLGMEALFAHERVMDALRIMRDKQTRVATYLDEYKERYGEYPIWLSYRPGHQDLGEHWMPLAKWTGPEDYVASWKALVESTGTRYLDDLGWGDDRTAYVLDGDDGDD